MASDADRAAAEAEATGLAKLIGDGDSDGGLVCISRNGAVAVGVHAHKRDQVRNLVDTLRAVHKIAVSMLADMGIDANTSETTVTHRSTKILRDDSGSKPS